MDRRGVTLVEVLVVTVIVFTLVGGMVLVFVQSGEQLWRRTDLQLTALTQAQIAINRLTEDLRRARQGVAFTCSPSTDTIQFEQIDGTQVSYRCESCETGSPGTLTRTMGAADPQIVASGLAAFEETCPPLGDGVVTIRLTAQASLLGRLATHTLESRVWIRNPEGP